MGKDSRTALHFFERAVELDPEFVSTYSFVAGTHSILGDLELARESCKAWELRNRASDQERFLVGLNYEKQVLGNINNGRIVNCGFRITLTMSCLTLFMRAESWRMGQFERAEEFGKRSLEIGPQNPYGYHNLANSYILRNRPEDAERVLKLLPSSWISANISPFVTRLHF